MMYSNNSLVPQQQQQLGGNPLMPMNSQYHQMHSYTQQQQQQSQHMSGHHQMNSMSTLDQNILSNSGLSSSSSSGLTKLEPSLITPEIDKEKEKQARENHCEIERRRRVKMAAYFNELCVMVPTCNTLQRKPDKLTILRMASTHMRNLRGNHSNAAMSNDSAYKPSFLTDQELKHLILEAADGFLFVSQCDTGNIIYVSDAVQSVLSYSPNEWSHRSLFDFIHPEDLEKVKDQLSTQENSSNNTTGRILDLKTGTVKKEGHPNSVRSHIGSRRSFVCRIKLGQQQHHLFNQQKNRQLLDPTVGGYWSSSNPRVHRTCLQSNLESSDPNRSNYSVVHITGYTKVWPPSSTSQSNGMMTDHSQKSIYHNTLDDQANLNGTNFHLIAIARIQMTSAPNDLVNSTNGEFVSRHDQNGLVTFADQRVTGLLGYQPADLLKKSLCDFLIPQDQQLFKEQLKTIYESKITQPVQLTIHFMNSINEVIPFTTSAYAFLNPCNDAFEFIVCTHLSQKYTETVSQLSNSSHNMSTVSTGLLSNNNNNNNNNNSANNLAGMDTSTGPTPQNYYNLQNQYNGNNIQHHQVASGQLGYQNQFMQSASNQFQQQQQQQSHTIPGVSNHQAPANYGNYLIMPSIFNE